VREREFLEMYRRGMEQCEQSLASSEPVSERVSERVGEWVFNEARVHSGCRGGALLRELSGGVTLWRFGPLQHCATHSTCW
jgi:hypothetical protein